MLLVGFDAIFSTNEVEKHILVIKRFKVLFHLGTELIWLPTPVCTFTIALESWIYESAHVHWQYASDHTGCRKNYKFYNYKINLPTTPEKRICSCIYCGRKKQKQYCQQYRSRVCRAQPQSTWVPLATKGFQGDEHTHGSL